MTTEQEVFNFATIGEVFDDGVSLIFDGHTEATEKHYKVNTSIVFNAGDRVKILADSGTYVVEYVVGLPMKPEEEEDPVGLPAGGSAGQVLKKSSGEDYDAAWGTIYGTAPSGGSTGQVLMKASGNSYDMRWGNISIDVDGTVPAGGSSGQVLMKSSGTDYAMKWGTISVSAVDAVVNKGYSGSNNYIRFKSDSSGKIYANVGNGTWKQISN